MLGLFLVGFFNGSYSGVAYSAYGCGRSYRLVGGFVGSVGSGNLSPSRCIEDLILFMCILGRRGCVGSFNGARRSVVGLTARGKFRLS